MTNEQALTMIEHAIDYLETRGYPDDGILFAISTLYEAHKAIGPMGQIPSWEREVADEPTYHDLRYHRRNACT